MNMIRKLIATAMIMIACWGLLSPEYILSSGSIEVINTDSGEKVPFTVEEHFWDLLNAKNGELIVKSRVWTYMTDT
ncbi:MAG: hypothetical protein R3Y67_06515 [Eubacteriales bacterium]